MKSQRLLVLARMIFCLSSFLFACLTLWSLATAAESDKAWNQDDFKIDEASLLDIRQFELVFRTGGWHSQWSDQNGTLNYNYAIYHNSSKNIDSNLYINPALNYMLENDKQVIKLGINPRISYNESSGEYVYHTKYSSQTTEQEGRNHQRNLGINGLLDFDWKYYGGSRLFLGSKCKVDGRESIFYRNASQMSKTDTTTAGRSQEKYNRETYNFIINASINGGWGRMVEGKYAYQALQLLADLADAGRLRKAAAREEILELAALISDARNVYVFDGRLKMLSALERIMTFIISRGFVAPEDLSALLVVDDTYRYVSEDSRAFGLQTGFRLGTELDIDNDEASTYNQDNVLQSYSKEEVSTFTTYAGLEIHYACPLDRHWQLTTSAYADYKYKRFNYGEDIPKRHFAIGAVEGKLDYYFNTRWRLGMGINGNITGDLVPFVISTRESYYRQYKESYRQIITAAGLSANMSYQLNTDLEWTASLSGRWEKSQCFDYSLEAEYPQPSVGIPPSVINQMHHDFMDELGFSWSIGTWLSYRIF